MRLLLAIALQLAIQANAFEVDNVSCGFRKLNDSVGALNAETNARIQKALDNYNNNIHDPLPKMMRMRKIHNSFQAKNTYEPVEEPYVPPNEPCGKGVLEALRATLASSWFGNLESWVNEAKIDKCSPAGKESVYRNVGASTGGVMTFAGLNSVINVNGIYIGADKLSHFMTEGFEYNKRWEELKTSDPDFVKNRIHNLKKVVAQGTQEEEGGYGWQATGIKSYGDMMADYGGFTFFQKIFDVKEPYLKCENKKWVVVKAFRWEDYVNRGMDESFNCNSYYDSNMGAAVDKAIAETTAKYSYEKSQRCPLDPEKCKEIAGLVQPAELVEDLVSPTCRGLPPEYKMKSAAEKPKDPWGGLLNIIKPASQETSIFPEVTK